MAISENVKSGLITVSGLVQESKKGEGPIFMTKEKHKGRGLKYQFINKK